MNRIKDFFYNKNDLIVVLLILVLAAGLIYYHVLEIMAYPEQLAESAAQTTSTETVQTEQSTEVPGDSEPKKNTVEKED